MLEVPWSQVVLVMMSEQELNDEVVAEEESTTGNHVSRSDMLLQPPQAATPWLFSNGGPKFLTSKTING